MSVCLVARNKADLLIYRQIQDVVKIK